MNNLTLGSLFDGSGGFPLGGLISGITPVWASEIEPFPIRVTTKRLPFIPDRRPCIWLERLCRAAFHSGIAQGKVSGLCQLVKLIL